MKIFDCEDEPNEFMEMPCRCDCGKWFDLDDGYPSKNGNYMVCKECADSEDDEEIDEEDDECFDEEDDSWQPCSDCDGHDACHDFGCAIKSGIINPVTP